MREEAKLSIRTDRNLGRRRSDSDAQHDRNHHANLSVDFGEAIRSGDAAGDALPARETPVESTRPERSLRGLFQRFDGRNLEAAPLQIRFRSGQGQKLRQY